MDILVTYAYAKIQLNDPHTAERILQRTLAVRKDVLSAYLGLANLYLASNRARQAVEVYNGMIAHRPELSEGYRLRGELFLNVGEMNSSYSDLSTALAIDPHNHQALLVRGRWHLKHNLLVKAYTDLSESVSFSRSALGLYYLAQANYALGRPCDASALHKEALLLDPTLVDIYLQKAQSDGTCGLMTESLRSYDLALTYKPHSTEIHSARGRAHLNIGRPRAALEDLETELALNPRDVGSMGLAAVCCQMLGRLEEAVHWLDRMLSLDYDPGVVKDRLRIARFRSQFHV